MSGRAARTVPFVVAALAVACVVALACAPGDDGSPGASEPAALEEAIDGLALDPRAERMTRAGELTQSTSELDVAEASRKDLVELRERGDCVLVRAGYLDLSGRTWGCVVQGSGWVEVRIIREESEGSELVVWHADVADVAEAL